MRSWLPRRQLKNFFNFLVEACLGSLRRRASGSKPRFPLPHSETTRLRPCPRCVGSWAEKHVTTSLSFSVRSTVSSTPGLLQRRCSGQAFLPLSVIRVGIASCRRSSCVHPRLGNIAVAVRPEPVLPDIGAHSTSVLLPKNSRVIDPDNSDALLVTSLRNKTSEDLLMYPVVTYGTEYIYEAVLIPVYSKPSGVRSHYASPCGS